MITGDRENYFNRFAGACSKYSKPTSEVMEFVDGTKYHNCVAEGKKNIKNKDGRDER